MSASVSAGVATVSVDAQHEVDGLLQTITNDTIGANQRVLLAGVCVVTPAAAGVTALWSIPSGVTGLNANDATLDIPAGRLAAGQTYVFQLACTAGNGSVSTSVTIRVNNPPSGSCSITGGTALTELTKATVSCTFTGDSLPLSYTFRYSTDAGVTTILFRDKLTTAQAQLLPPKAPNGLVITVTVSDANGATATSTVNATVTALSVTGAAADTTVQNLITSDLNDAISNKDVGFASNAISAASELLSSTTASGKTTLTEQLAGSLNTLLDQPVSASAAGDLIDTTQDLISNGGTLSTEANTQLLGTVSKLGAAVKSGMAEDSAKTFATTLNTLAKNNSSNTASLKTLADTIDQMAAGLGNNSVKTDISTDTFKFSTTPVQLDDVAKGGSFGSSSDSQNKVSIPDGALDSVLGNLKGDVNVQFASFDFNPYSAAIGSKVVRFNLLDSAGNPISAQNLDPPAVINVALTAAPASGETVACSSYDENTATWVTTGCTHTGFTDSTNTVAICSCTHFTDFGGSNVVQTTASPSASPSTGSSPSPSASPSVGATETPGVALPSGGVLKSNKQGSDFVKIAWKRLKKVVKKAKVFDNIRSWEIQLQAQTNAPSDSPTFGDWTTAVTLKARKFRIAVRGLNSNTFYKFRIRALYKNGLRSAFLNGNANFRTN